jgi:hypothetical protein
MVQYSIILDTEYYKMPKLSKFDDFDRCLSSFEESMFCVAEVHIKPDQSSTLWNYIEVSENQVWHYVLLP